MYHIPNSCDFILTDGKDIHEFQIEEFKYKGMISQPYILEVVVTSNIHKPIELKQGLFAQMTFKANKTEQFFTGYLDKVNRIYSHDTRKYKYHFKIAPNIELLKHHREVQTFYKSSKQSVIDYFLDYVYPNPIYSTSDASSYYFEDNWALSLFTEQFNRTIFSYSDDSLDLVQDLCNFGLIYYFRHKKDKTDLIFTPCVKSFLKEDIVDLCFDSNSMIPIENDSNFITNMEYHADNEYGNCAFKVRHYHPLSSKRNHHFMMKSNEEEGLVTKPHYYDCNKLVADDLLTPKPQLEILEDKLKLHYTGMRDTLNIEGHFGNLKVGSVVDIDSCLTKYQGRYFVYELDMQADYNRNDQRFYFKTKAILIPYPEDDPSMKWLPPFYEKHSKMPDYLNYVKINQGYQTDENGMKSVRLSKGLIPYQKKEKTFWVRAAQESATAGGGGDHSTRLESECVLIMPEESEPVISGYMANSNVPSIATGSNAQATTLKTDGGFLMQMNRWRSLSYYNNIQLIMADALGRRTGVQLGGIDMIPKYKGASQNFKHFQGVHIKGHSLSLEQVQQNYGIDVGKGHYHYSITHGDKKQRHIAVNEKSNTDYYRERYYTKARATTPAAANLPHISKLWLSTTLGVGDIFSSLLIWEYTPDNIELLIGSCVDIYQGEYDSKTAQSITILPDQGRLQAKLPTKKGETYKLKIKHIYDLKIGSGDKAKNYSSVMDVSFCANPAFSFLIMNDIRPNKKNPQQWDAMLSWGMEGADANGISNYQISADKVGKVSCKKSWVPFAELNGSEEYNFRILAQYNQGIDQEMEFGIKTELTSQAQAAESQPLPGHEIEMTTNGITETHNLAEAHQDFDYVTDKPFQHNYIDNLRQSHKHALTPKNYTSKNVSNYINTFDVNDFAYLPQLDGLEDKAKNVGLTTKSKLINYHKGSTTVDHQGSTKETVQSKSESIKMDAKDISIENTKSYNLKRSGKSYNYQGKDLIFNTPKATRQIKDCVLQGEDSLVVNAQNIFLKSGDVTIQCEEYDQTYGHAKIIGQSHYHVEQGMHFDFYQAKPSANSSVAQARSDYKNLFAQITQYDADKTKTVYVKGLQTLNVKPKWRKLMAGGDDTTSFAALARTPIAVQKQIMGMITSLYVTLDAESDKNLKQPKDDSKWSEVVSAGFTSQINVNNAKVTKSQQEIETLQLDKDYKTSNLNKLNDSQEQKSLDSTLNGDNNDHQEQKQNLEQGIAEDDKEIAKLNEVITKSQKNISSLKSQQSSMIEIISNLINDYLYPVHAQELRSGYIYIYLTDARVSQEDGETIYSKPRLFKEYKVTYQPSSAHIEGECHYTEVPLDYQSGLDQRPSKHVSPTAYVEVPAAYIKEQTENPLDPDNASALDKVQIFFSDVQLSWARAHVYGGLEQSDKRFVASSGEEKNDLINKLDDSSCNSAMLNKRAETIDSQQLLHAWQQKHSKTLTSWFRAKLQILEANLSTSFWKKLDVFYPDKDTNASPYLLLNDDVGVILEQNQLIYAVRQNIVAMVDSIQNNNELKTAILGFQFFYNPRSNGLAEVVTTTNNINSSPDSMVGVPEQFKHYLSMPESLEAINKGKSDLDENKFNYALKLNQRRLYKKLITKMQGNVVNLLTHLDDSLMQDHFSQGQAGYIAAHTGFWGLLEPSLMDPNQIDGVLNKSTLELDKVSFELVQTDSEAVDDKAIPQTVEVRTQGVTSPTGYTIFHYTYLEKITTCTQRLEGFQIISTAKEYILNPKFNKNKTEDENNKRWIQTKNKSTVIEENTAAQPNGFAYLEQLLTGKRPFLSSLLFPSANQGNLQQTIKENEIYKKADGKYNAAFLSQANASLIELLQENNEADKEPIAEKNTEFKDELKEKAIAQTQKFIDGIITSWQLKDAMLSSETSISLKKSLAAMMCDLCGQSRDTFTIDKVSTERPAVYQTISKAGLDEISKDLSGAFSSSDNENQQYVIINSKGENQYFKNYAETREGLINLNNESKNQLSNIEKVEANVSAKTRLIAKEDAVFVVPVADVKKAEKRLEKMERFGAGFKIPLNTFTAVSVIAELNEACANANESPSLFNVLSVGKYSLSSIKEGLELTEVIAKAAGKKEALEEFKKHLGLKIATTMKSFAGMSDSITRRELKQSIKDLQSSAIYQYTDVADFIGVTASSIGTIQSMLKWVESMNQNDKAVAASNFFNVLSNGFATASTVQGITKKVAEGVAKNTVKTGGDAFASAMSKGSERATKKGYNYFGEALLKTFEDLGFKRLSGSIVGLLIPGFDILMLLSFASDIASIIALYFQDNAYQSWAKKTIYSKTKEPDVFKDLTEAYMSLLSLIASPTANITTTKDSEKLNAEEIYNLSFNLPGNAPAGMKTNIDASLLCRRKISDGKTLDPEFVRQKLAIPLKPIRNAISGIVESFKLTISEEELYQATVAFVSQGAKQLHESVAGVDPFLGQETRYSTIEKSVNELVDQIADGSKGWMHSNLFSLEISGNIEIANKTIPNNDAESYKAKDNLDKLLSGNGIYKYQQEDYFEVTGFTQAIKEKLGQLKQDAINYIQASKDTGNKVSFINENTLALEKIG